MLMVKIESKTAINTQIQIFLCFQITSWAVFTFIINYMKISIVSIFRYQEGRALVWVGTVNQTSAAIGSIISFALVNYTKMFVSYEPC